MHELKTMYLKGRVVSAPVQTPQVAGRAHASPLHVARYDLAGTPGTGLPRTYLIPLNCYLPAT